MHSAYDFFQTSLKDKFDKKHKPTVNEVLTNMNAASLNGGRALDEIVDNMLMTGGALPVSSTPVNQSIDAVVDNMLMTGGSTSPQNKFYIQYELKPAHGKNINMKDADKVYNKFVKMCTDHEGDSQYWMTALFLEHHLFKGFSQKYAVSNAYVKLMEIFTKFDFVYANIKHFDIAAAPGYFIKAMQDYCSKQSIPYEYKACSLKDGLKPLKDVEMFEFNVLHDEMPEEYIGKFNLVTGDIGQEHDHADAMETLCHDLDVKQLYHALKLLSPGGNCILKMFTYTKPETCQIVDEFSRNFTHAFVIKPLSSRLLNDETYLIGINFKQIEPVIDTNADTLYTLEKQRAKIREQMLEVTDYIASLYKEQNAVLNTIIPQDKNNKVITGGADEEFSGLVEQGSDIVCVLTGNGLKDPDNAIKYSNTDVKKTSSMLNEIIKVMKL